MINNDKPKISSEKGITLVALIITVVVMLIIAGISVSTGLESADSTRLQGFYTKLEIIQKRADDIAVTNESYIDSEGNVVYLKEAGTAYVDLSSDKQTTLQEIVANEGEGIITNVDKFRYFTIQQVEDLLDISEIGYNVFIDFETRTVIAEQGITVNGETYHILKNNIYYAQQNKKKKEGDIISLGYNIYHYGTSKYKIIVMPSNAVGDLNIGGTIKWKKTTTKYWESSSNLEMEINELTEYNVEYIDKNNNIISDTVKLQLDEAGDPIVISSKYWSQNKTSVVKMDENGDVLQTLEVGEEVKFKIGNEEAVKYTAGDYTGSWLVLGAEYGRLLLVSSTNVSSRVALGAGYGGTVRGTVCVAGYYNGDEKLDEICSSYLNETYATRARSIKVEDINRVTGYVPETVLFGSGQVYQYGNEVTYILEDDGTVSYSSVTQSGTSEWTSFTMPDETVLTKDMSEGIKIKSRSYYYYPNTLTTSSSTATEQGISTSSKAYTALFSNTNVGSGSYWLANQFEYAGAGGVDFGLRTVLNGMVSVGGLWYSYKGENDITAYGARAVVMLKSNVQVVKE